MGSPLSNSSLMSNSMVLEKSLTLAKDRRDIRKHITWGFVNAIVFSILLYDIINSCPLYLRYYDYIEYALLLIIGTNLLYYASRILVASVSLNSEQIVITSEQKTLLGVKDEDPNYTILSSPQVSEARSRSQSPVMSPSVSFGLSTPNTPMNSTAQSWMSNLSSNESLNYSLPSPTWTFHKPSIEQHKYAQMSRDSPLLNSMQYRDTSGIDFIADETDLDKYLKEFEANSSAQRLSDQTQQHSNLLSSFWSHPITKTAKDMSTFLKNCTYQLSLQVPDLRNASPKGKAETKSSPKVSQTSALVAWSRMNVDIVTLTQWNENLRRWISQTILERLVHEFDRVDESLEKIGLTDIKVGRVGLDRIRKTAQMAQVADYIPSLSTLIPFLEVTANQEYLEKRIRELAKGGCMSEFKWNGGSSYNGKDWDESLPTDSAIIMHLLASYLDTQLMPLPSMPDTKPFSGLHYIKCKDKIPQLAPNSLYIQQVSEKPPHYRVVVGETIYEMVKGYSNLFHTILFFLYHVHKREHGMLGRVNLGRAGVNMLWIIGQ